jgi:2-isopropylmalate synthase
MRSCDRDNSIIILDTTMRDGELAPGFAMNLQQKIELAQLLEQMGVDVIEVSYPGQSAKDSEELTELSKLIKNSTICGLASSKPDEILSVVRCLKSAAKGRIHTYANVRVNSQDELKKEQVIEEIRSSVVLARNYCDDVEWSAFDATRSELDFLGKTIETAIQAGATTINIPDSLGQASPEAFSQLLNSIFHNVTNLDRVVVSVHCHDDRGRAVENSLAALNCGVRQIECSINGLGARAGNTDLVKVIEGILVQNKYQIELDLSALERASEFVEKITSSIQV